MLWHEIGEQAPERMTRQIVEPVRYPSVVHNSRPLVTPLSSAAAKNSLSAKAVNSAGLEEKDN
jgi:hypothetical protein